MPIFLRVSSTEWLEETDVGKEHGSWDVASTIELTKIVSKLGVDFLDVSSGGNHPAQRINMFRSADYQQDRSELVFVVTVHLVKPLLGVQAGRLALAALAALARRFGAGGSVHAGDQTASSARPHVPIVSPVAQLACVHRQPHA